MVSPRRKYKSPTKVKSKPKPKPVINYPPVSTRKWIPPDQRKKKPRPPSYVKPEGITQKLDVSSLEKVWHNFKIVGGSAFLCGNFSECNKRFLPKTNGFQGSCNCLIAIAFSKLYQMKTWNSLTLDTILELGDQLYLKTSAQTANKCQIFFDVDQVFNSFYVDNQRITMAVGDKDNKLVDKLHIDMDQKAKLMSTLQTFLKEHISGICNFRNTHFAIWRSDNSIYMFDPADHGLDGLRICGGIIGEGVAVIYKVKTVSKLANCILNNINGKYSCVYTIHPVGVQKMVKINIKPPNSLKEIYPNMADICRKERKEKAAAILQTKHKNTAQPPPQPQPPPPPPPVVKEIEQPINEISPDACTWMKSNIPTFPKSKIPVEKPKTPSISFFIDLSPEKQGILRASTHQCDPAFTPYNGAQALSNAVSAIAMLRIYKSRYWIKKIVDDILKSGNIIHHDTKKNVGVGKKIKPMDIVKKITITERDFEPVLEDYAVLGKLRSTDPKVLDLFPALSDFLKESDACIIIGPLTLAVWVEDNFYYMFDPNERDQYGRVIYKQSQIGSEIVVVDYIPGVACVTWYKSLKDLVETYMNNVERSYRRNPFSLCKVQINDYIEISDPWHNFQSLSRNKWILRGTFNQNNQLFSSKSRNVQCTANATTALVYTKLKPIQEWSSDTLDEILLTGDKIYSLTVDHLKQQNAFKHPMLMVDEMKRKFTIENVEVALEIDDCLVNGLITADEDSGILDLKRGFEEFFKENDTGVLTSHSISVGIFKKDEAYYYFDSHSRDENGVVTSFGTSCILRVTNIDELAKSIETNLGPNSSHMYNIGRIVIKLFQTVEGVALPPLNEYTQVGTHNAILRSSFSEASAEKFPLSKSKQTIPMTVTALLMNLLMPAAIWSQEEIDKILEIGNKYYIESMSDYKPPVDMNKEMELDESGNPIIEEDLITTDNIKKVFKIGVNKFETDFEEIDSGNMEEFEEKMELRFGSGDMPGSRIPELLFETDNMVLSIWQDENVFYLFDSKQRDQNGEIFGKDDWSEKVDIEYEDENVDEADNADEEIVNPVDKINEEGAGDATTAETPTPVTEPPLEETPPEQIITEDEEDTEPQGPPVPVKIKKSLTYWRNLEASDGKAFAMWFTDFKYLINHIVNNTPPNKRRDMEFTLKAVKIKNNPETKEIFDPETQERESPYEGDWYEFKEVGLGFWILRGTMNLNSEMYPIINRNKQDITSCFAALGFAHLYATAKFKPSTVDNIQKYGDRLYSFTIRTRKSELKKNVALRLTEKEIFSIVENEKYNIMDYTNKFCIHENMIILNIAQNFLTGDIHAQDYEKPDELLDLNRAFDKFFQDNKVCILNCKGRTVAIWQKTDFYYMYDPYCRGPNGGISTTGVPCITRYAGRKEIPGVFLKTLPIEGLNTFTIHKVEISSQQCPRERHPIPEPEVLKSEKLGGFKFIVPGKCILRGTISQESPEFDRGSNIQSAPVAFIALTMSLIHKPKTWSKPIIDEIIRVGDQLYIDSVAALGYEFNPWEDYLDVYKVKNDYKIGVLKANCELRNMDQRGVIDIKNSPITLNLRQGLEKFFEENTHGIFVTNGLVLAVWEEEEIGQDTLIYLFDPNPRGPTGLPLPGGLGCTVSFLNAKMCSDHIISCINDVNQRMETFVIVPVEILVGNMKTKRKLKKILQPEVQLKKCDPKCILETNRQLRKIADLERKKKEAKRQFMLGRTTYFEASGGLAVLRGLRSQNSDKYDEYCRGNQDIPNCIVAYVMHKIISIEKWTHKIIDSIMDAGNQLYIDSCVTYNVKNPKLGLKNVLRRFYIRNAEAQVVIYKPIDAGIFNSYSLSIVLTSYFDQEQFCILHYKDQWVSLFLKSGQFYVFDPHDRDIAGNKTLIGSAVVLRFTTLNAMCEKIYNNLTNPNEENNSFSLVLISLKNIIRK